MPKAISFLILLFFFADSTFAQGPIPRAEARIDQVFDTYNLSGQGVLAVMLDRGIDYRHPDFRNPDGTTRIAYIYDLYNPSGANDPDNPYGVGTIFDSTEINAALMAGGEPITNDLGGHGTATTGIFAGNGSGIADNERYRGVAHKSRIVSVVVTRDFVPPFSGNPGQAFAFDPNLLPTAFDFAQDKIEEIGLPSVTLLNIGSVGNPSDGSTLVCAAIDDFVAAGHPFLCGVGDDGGAVNSVEDELEVGEETIFSIEKGEAGNLRFTAYYPESDRVNLSIDLPNGTTLGPFDPPTGPNDGATFFGSDVSVFHQGANLEFSSSTSPIRQILVDISGETGTYQIRLDPTTVENDGRIFAYLNPSLYFNSNRFTGNVTRIGNINEYSSCASTISPGDYVATSSWTDINGVDRSRTGEGAVGDLWIGSSIGPTIDSRFGIDIVAPGEIAAAAYSLDSRYGFFEFNVLEDSEGLYGIQTAVSAAAPIVAGVIALMLEANPSLSPDQIRQILQETAREDNFTGSVPNANWGYGKLDALAAVEEAIDLVSTEENHRTIQVTTRVSPNPFREHINVQIAPDVEVEFWQFFRADGKLVLSGHRIEELNRISSLSLSGGFYWLAIDTNAGRNVHRLVKMPN